MNKNSKAMKQIVDFLIMVFFVACFIYINKSFADVVDARKTLTRDATLWISQQLKISEDKINVVAPDKRVRIVHCKNQLKFDFPFDSKETVRAKCDNPNWQFFFKS